MELYSYFGPVMEFGKCVANNWKAETWAPSEKKAKNNIIFQYKKATGKLPGTKVELPGPIIKGGV